MSNDTWIQEIWNWADRCELSDEQIPRDKGRLLAMTKLYVSYLSLDELHEDIGQLINLEYMYVDGNNIVYLPESIGNLTNLKGFYVRDNNLAGLPDGIQQLANLQQLDVRCNCYLFNSEEDFQELQNFLPKTNIIVDENSFYTSFPPISI